MALLFGEIGLAFTGIAALVVRGRAALALAIISFLPIPLTAAIVFNGLSQFNFKVDDMRTYAPKIEWGVLVGCAILSQVLASRAKKRAASVNRPNDSAPR